MELITKDSYDKRFIILWKAKTRTHILEMHFLRSPNNIKILYSFIIYPDSKKTRVFYRDYGQNTVK
jgi:hypothetical protein